MNSSAMRSDTALWADFQILCDFGGRLSGTSSESAAMDWLRTRGAEVCGVACRDIPVSYKGWRALHTRLTLAGGYEARCHPLVRTVGTEPGGLTAEVIDLGRGTPEEFEAHRAEIAGRIVLVRHELMFAAGTIHRRRKYDLAREMGAVGFLIAGPTQGDVVAGSSGRVGDAGIPALGIAPETAARLARTAHGWPSATLDIAIEESQAETASLVFDLPGLTDEWVVLCAHVDGHDLAESAMDNASGVAAALAAARAVAPRVPRMRRGLRLAFFSVEEWALTGSAQYVEAMDEATRKSIAIVINLDSVGGSPRLSALTSGFAGLEPFL
uniref:M28 family peptidase n=1 Tax=Microvirga massiliensis TaxID=1033741 RepID=UPI000A457827